MAFTSDEKSDLFRMYRYRKSVPYYEFEEDLNLTNLVEADIRRVVFKRANSCPRRLANEIITFMNAFGWEHGKALMLKHVDTGFHPYLVKAFDILRTYQGNLNFEELFLSYVRQRT